MGKKVTVRNTLKEGNNIIIKEGNANVYREKAILKPGKKYVLTLDHNATYREYVLITLPDNTALPAFSSDDLAEWKEVVVKERMDWTEASGEDKFYWECDPVADVNPTVLANASTGTTSTGTTSTGTPSTDTTSTGTPSTGTPSTSTPLTGTPSTGTPSTGTASTGTASTGTASTGTASTGTPSTGTPTKPGKWLGRTFGCFHR